MGKYGEAIGKLRISINGFEAELKPKVGDKEEWVSMTIKNKKEKDILYKKLIAFMKEKISRDIPPTTDEEKKELDEFVEFNSEDLQKEFMIFYRLITREELELAEEELKKKVNLTENPLEEV